MYAMGKIADEKKEIECKTGRNVRYICPQKISISDNSEKVNLYFRVLSPELGAKLVAKSGDKVIAQKKEIKVNPGEMNCITVDTSDIENDLTIEVVKED